MTPKEKHRTAMAMAAMLYEKNTSLISHRKVKDMLRKHFSYDAVEICYHDARRTCFFWRVQRMNHAEDPK